MDLLLKRSIIILSGHIWTDLCQSFSSDASTVPEQHTREYDLHTAVEIMTAAIIPVVGITELCVRLRYVFANTKGFPLCFLYRLYREKAWLTIIIMILWILSVMPVTRYLVRRYCNRTTLCQ